MRDLHKREVMLAAASELQRGDSIQVICNGLVVVGEIDKNEVFDNNALLTVNVFTDNTTIQINIVINKDVEVPILEMV